MSVVGARLARAVDASAADAGVAVTLGPLASRAWHSALFSGEQHEATLTGQDNAATAAWLAALPDVEWRVPGQIVDVEVPLVTRRDGRLTATLHLHTIAA